MGSCLEQRPLSRQREGSVPFSPCAIRLATLLLCDSETFGQLEVKCGRMSLPSHGSGVSDDPSRGRDVRNDNAPYCRTLRRLELHLWAVPFMILLLCMNSNLIVAYLASMGAGASVAAAFLLPWFAGYVTGGCSQPKAVDLTLKMLVSPVPIALIVVGLLIFKTYPINEARRQNNRMLLQQLRAREDSESSDSTV
ncbi:hypothetical protein JZ751_018941 [Albula glossodonta]|uniref:Uncharacterized protein n=1 Tax=Albula glossodonta TaxID=121402 RepID=A0A8T2N196_9TELE|nr:hypothetical protein JZ751_018941 [Albula glossodonta]